MARRVIATAEVQVAADVAMAEAGIEGLSDTFRSLGSIAERAAQRAEAAFFQGAKTIQQAFGNAEDAVLDVILRLDQGNENARHMANSFLKVAANISKAQQEGQGLQASTEQMVELLRQASGSAGIFENNLEDAAKQARRLADEADLIGVAVQSAKIRAEQLERAFRDVGRAIDLAMAGGLEQVQGDIRETIRRLDDMGGEFKKVGAIGRRALDDIAAEAKRADANLEDAARASMRLAQQLRDVEQGELRRVADEARDAAAALDRMADQARHADRSLGGIGDVSRRVSGDVRGLIGLLGAGGLGYAAVSVARFGLDMTQQLEKSGAAFLGLTGSVEGASNMLERMVTFARDTPYNLQNVTNAAAQLLAVGDGFGVTTSNIEEYLTTFGDAISITGGGNENFERLVRVFGQMSSSGKVLGQDMNQLAQNLPGFDVWQALADGANVSVAELRRLQDLGTLDELLTGNKAVEILVAGMKKIPGAAGAMDRQLNTLGGSLEKFKETAQFAINKGLEPFSDTLQDTLSDPVILRSVENLADAFGDFLSSGLEELAPELDDLAVAGENFLRALGEFTPAFGEVVDAVGDFLNFVSPLVSGFGKFTSAVLGAENGLGKLAVAALAFVAGGPIGIAAGVVLAVSGALDLLDDSNEEAANSARLLAAAQGEVNAAMAVGEEAIYSEAQQAAINSANDLRENQAELFNSMKSYGVTIADMNNGFAALNTGTGTVSVAFAKMYEAIHDPNVTTEALGQFRAMYGEYLKGTDVITEEAAKQADAVEVAGTDVIAADAKRVASSRAQTEAILKHRQAERDGYKEHVNEYQTISERWGELDEERTETLAGLLTEQADAYAEWEADINGSTADAGASLSDLADEFDNNVGAMTKALNENSIDIFGWKADIVSAAAILVSEFGVSDTAAKDFIGTLGEIGPGFAPGVADLVDGSEEGKAALKAFFDASTLASGVAASSMTDDLDVITGAAPTIAESLADGTLTVEEILAAIPAAMTAAGIDLETAASQIDIADDLGLVGGAGVDGLVNALSSAAALARVSAASASLAGASISAIERRFDTGSPSRVTYEIGEFVVEGLIGGIQNMSDEAVATAVQTASLMSGGIADHFADAEDPQEEARKFAEDVAESIIDELIAEQENVADAAEALAEAAADRLREAWDRVKDRFLNRDIKEAVIEAQAELSEALADLRSAESLAGASGTAAIAAAESRVARAEAALAAAEATDVAADLIAGQTLTAFQRATEDTVAALQAQQEAETASIQARIDAAKRNLDPVSRAAAEADLAATKERHETEMTALDRRREDEEEVLQLRLDNENEVREAAVKAREDELGAFEDALDDIVDSVRDAIENLPDLRDDITTAQRGVEDAFFDQFEQMLENIDTVDRNLLQSVGTSAGLTQTEQNDLIAAAINSSSANAGATAANLGVGQLLDLLSTGLYTIGADGALGIAAGLSDGARAIADAMFASLQYAIKATLYGMQIKSPSRVTERLIGEPMAEGIAKGIMNAKASISSAMNGLLDNVVNGTSVPSASQLVDTSGGSTQETSMYRGPLVTMPGAIIQDATDADLVAQRVLVALAATGVNV